LQSGGRNGFAALTIVGAVEPCNASWPLGLHVAGSIARPRTASPRTLARPRVACALHLAAAAMDRLFVASPPVSDDLLRRLADADRSVSRWARRRRRSVELTVIAGALCWAATRLALPKSGFETILFVVCGVTAISLALVERRARRERERLAGDLPAELVR